MGSKEFDYTYDMMQKTDQCVTDDVYGKVNHWALHNAMKTMDAMRRNGDDEDFSIDKLFRYAMDKFGAAHACMVARAADLINEFAGYEVFIKDDPDPTLLTMAIETGIGLALHEATKSVMIVQNGKEFIAILPSKGIENLPDKDKVSAMATTFEAVEIALDFDVDKYLEDADEEKEN